MPGTAAPGKLPGKLCLPFLLRGVHQNVTTTATEAADIQLQLTTSELV